MKLLTEELLKNLPALYTTESVELKDKIVVCKFFCPWGAYTFYCIECSKEYDDYILWGFADGFDCPEFGYSSVAELTSVTGPGGLKIERDISWEPTKCSDIPQIMKHIRG